MKKVIILFLLSLFLTGCTHVVELTPEEENIIVDEMTEIILSPNRTKNNDNIISN